MSERKLVFIASPYAGDVEHNIEMAKQYCRHAMKSGCDFFCPHLMYPTVLDDNNPTERQTGIRMGLHLLSVCNELWVCGGTVSAGMRTEIAEAERLGIRIVPVQLEVAQDLTEKKWGIWARRSAASVCGAAEAWVKSNDRILAFDTYKEAAEQADSYMRNIGTVNVSYYPKKLGPEQLNAPSPSMGLGLT